MHSFVVQKVIPFRCDMPSPAKPPNLYLKYPEFECLADGEPEKLAPYSFLAEMRKSIPFFFRYFFLSMLIPGLAWAIVYVISENRELYQLYAQGVVVQGEMIEKYKGNIMVGKTIVTHTFIRYRFTTLQGKTYTAEIEAYSDEDTSFVPNAPVMVRYLPNDPTVSRFANREPRSLEDVLPMLGFMVLAAGALTGAIYLLEIRRSLTCIQRQVHRLLARHATLIYGNVFACKPNGKGWGWRGYTVTYKFTTPKGHELTKDVYVHAEIRTPLFEHPLEPGTPMLVLYLDDEKFALL